MEQNNTVFVALPGVPYEMKALVNYQLIPKISSRFKRPFLLHKTLLTHGLGESVIAQRISDIESNLPKHIKLAYLPNLGRVRLRLSGKGLDELQLKLDVEQQVQKILPLLSDIFVGFEEDSSIETVVGKALVARSKTLALAESCTGGKIAERITSQPGVSAFFKGSIVAYSTASKINLLKLNPELINQHSVVSKSIAESMALKVKKMFESDYAIATTGNAGPSKGESNAELGTVFIAVATPERVYSECFNFGTSRYRVIHKSVNMAFQMLQKEIFKN
jgi:nicotinamide-nucleotide amidase